MYARLVLARLLSCVPETPGVQDHRRGTDACFSFTTFEAPSLQACKISSCNTSTSSGNGFPLYRESAGLPEALLLAPLAFVDLGDRYRPLRLFEDATSSSGRGRRGEPT